ncbi:hypothetical protein ACH4TX_04470 [Streptomyces sp. NPDC021098]|uniref:hypothetical protein n=1 Tax=unclassified Streptomyces TaxID=2593676 RepID=UPI003798A21D
MSRTSKLYMAVASAPEANLEHRGRVGGDGDTDPLDAALGRGDVDDDPHLGVGEQHGSLPV